MSCCYSSVVVAVPPKFPRLAHFLDPFSATHASSPSPLFVFCRHPSSPLFPHSLPPFFKLRVLCLFSADNRSLYFQPTSLIKTNLTFLNVYKKKKGLVVASPARQSLAMEMPASLKVFVPWVRVRIWVEIVVDIWEQLRYCGAPAHHLSHTRQLVS